jgi:hypothetical protein
MSDTIIKLEPVLSVVEANISKKYRLGQVGTWWLNWVEAQTIRGDFQSCRLSESKPGGTVCMEKKPPLLK